MLIYISSIFILFFGLFFIFALHSKITLEKTLIEVSLLIEEFDLDKFKLHPRKPNDIYFFIKRIIDVIFSLINIILFLPLFIIIFILIKLDSKGPPIIKQRRIGKGGKIFYAYKFRTTVFQEETISKNIMALKYDSRITRLGLFLHYTAIEELPKLINVFLGDMSLVGTSLATGFDYDDIPKEIKNFVMSYKPGITSLWVVSLDRHNFNYKRKIFFDLYYLNNMSFKLDLSIIFKTIVKVLGTTASY